MNARAPWIRIESSKSLLNRALVIQSFAPRIVEVEGNSSAADVRDMRIALQQFSARQPIWCGSAGTVFRFMALRASRESGTFVLTGTSQLLSRPHDELIQMLAQLGVRAEFCDDGFGRRFFVVSGQGWKQPLTPLKISASISSQFLSAITLSSWNLNFDLECQVDGQHFVSESYFTMSLALLRQAGMNVEFVNDCLKIKSSQSPTPTCLKIEPDLSSSFASAAMGLFAPHGVRMGWPVGVPLQPDAEFVEILRSMGAMVDFSSGVLTVSPIVQSNLTSFQPIDVSLKECPDLGPVLSVLCVLAAGTSRLRDVGHLRHKESDRLQKIQQLLNVAGVSSSIVETESDLALEIDGMSRLPTGTFRYDCADDHRMAMAAGLLIRIAQTYAPQFVLHLDGAESVAKSYSRFWADAAALGFARPVTLLVGQRGVGKSRWGQGLAETRGVPFYDLDVEVERDQGQKVFDLFARIGEPAFRELERSTLDRLLSSQEISRAGAVIALGAGYEGTLYPTVAETLWIQRESDLSGRIFVDRPRLNPGQLPLEEFRMRAQSRAQRWTELFESGEISERVLLPEGELRKFFEASLNLGLGSIRTPRTFAELREALAQNPDLIELRTDLWTPDALATALKFVPFEKLLVSLRGQSLANIHLSGIKAAWLDVDLSLLSGEFEPTLAQVENVILSSHDQNYTQLASRAQGLKNAKVHLKSSPVIETWADLRALYQWQQEDAGHRSIFPRSDSLPGRWSWMRAYMKGRQRFHFVRTSLDSEVADQLTPFQWQMSFKNSHQFAAVLGDPVLHSWTPTEYAAWSSERQIPVWAIPVTRDEWSEALELLCHLGLRYAAVTAPLKDLAFASASLRTERAQICEAVNTMVWDAREQNWRGENTDLPGLEALSLNLPKNVRTVVWGGGGMLGALKELFEDASFVSAREALLTRGPMVVDPELLIWAGPTSGEYMPPDGWRPRVVIDLSYRENSAARSYVLKLRQEGVKVRFLSGEKMFRRQAHFQREFWNNYGG